jgi:alpha-L-rhamnosidase
MGQNMVGWCRLNLPYNPKQSIRFRYGEMLYDDGSLYTDNLRGAKAIDVYIPYNEQTVCYEPRFTYHGFRYVEIEGLTQAPQLEILPVKLRAKAAAQMVEAIKLMPFGNKTHKIGSGKHHFLIKK